jgi:imidazole glycerol-phosphate synthase subunit HisH
MVTIIDYGIGNLRSIEKAFQAVGAEVIRTDDPDLVESAERVVLPGVGAFGSCAAEIRRRGLEEPIMRYVASGRPFLGVCVGMQLLFDTSDELGSHRGLGILPGRVTRFEGVVGAAEGVEPSGRDRRLKVPHMGWNAIHARHGSALLDGVEDRSFFYFVHSYHVEANREADVLAYAQYGVDFPAIVHRDNVFGVQFHPEKSQRNGLQILKNFSLMVA